jgi:hypothetical protein
MCATATATAPLTTRHPSSCNLLRLTLLNAAASILKIETLVIVA